MSSEPRSERYRLAVLIDADNTPSRLLTEMFEELGVGWSAPHFPAMNLACFDDIRENRLGFARNVQTARADVHRFIAARHSESAYTCKFIFVDDEEHPAIEILRR